MADVTSQLCLNPSKKDMQFFFSRRIVLLRSHSRQIRRDPGQMSTSLWAFFILNTDTASPKNYSAISFYSAPTGSIMFLVFMTHFQKIILAFALFFSLLGAEKYTSKWDNIDVDEILHSSRLLENYKKCLMDEGNCTPEGSELKSNLRDALQTECSKCTSKQKSNAEKIINYLIENKREWWEELEKKFDPTGIYYKRYLEHRNKTR